MSIHGPEWAQEFLESPHQFSRHGYGSISDQSRQYPQTTSTMANYSDYLPRPNISLQQLCTPWVLNNVNDRNNTELYPVDPIEVAENHRQVRARARQRSWSLDSPHPETMNVTTSAPCSSLRQLCTPWQDPINPPQPIIDNNTYDRGFYSSNTFQAPAAADGQRRAPTNLQLENFGPMRFPTLQRSLTIGSPHTPSERFKVRGLDLGQDSPILKLQRFKVRTLDLGGEVKEGQGAAGYR
uniref:Uncharacterized protein n=1 Tax=Nelumbo nucifera TaxID=4432 RepID=A0A822YH03_NELNU|nr:TPA_asm: hypothetical protein HUJ06_030216 [Nelumbo nucifera]